MMNSSDSFTNFKTTVLFCKTEFVYLVICIANVSKKQHSISWKNMMYYLVKYVLRQSVPDFLEHHIKIKSYQSF